MRKLLAILACKLAAAVGRLIGRGSSLPGSVALKLCPDILGRIRYPKTVLAVTGSNGKTSTTEMIAAVLRADGREVVYNKEGSNQIQGVVTTVLTHCTLSGVMRGDVLLLESDERYAVHSFKYFRPTHMVVLDLYRDQLTRNGHPEWVYDCLKPAVFPQTHLILNADDPLSSCYGEGREEVTWFGVERNAQSTQEPSGAYRDGSYCPVCKSPMQYAWYHFNQMGDYRCEYCGHARRTPDFAVTAVDPEGGNIVINQKVSIHLAFFSVYSVYNCAAAFAACSLVGVPDDVIAATISRYILHNGRVVSFRLGRRHGTLLISKHENSIGYDTNLRYICAQHEKHDLMVIVDAVSRKYFTGETSWLWDIDFDQLVSDRIENIYLTGRYVNDLAVRFAFTEVPAGKLYTDPDIRRCAAAIGGQPGNDLFVMTCFSDMNKILSLVEKED